MQTDDAINSDKDDQTVDDNSVSNMEPVDKQGMVGLTLHLSKSVLYIIVLSSGGPLLFIHYG